MNSQKINQIMEKTVDGRYVTGAVLSIRQGGDTVFAGGAGRLRPESPYFIASTTKLYTTALIMKLRSEERLALDDPIAEFLGPDLVRGLNVHKGIDHSSEITVRQLLAHTSGIPDYFSGRDRRGASLEKELTRGRDRAWTFEDSLGMAKAFPSAFPPGAKKKALYSDTNFQILGRLIEIIRGDRYERVLRREIFEPLGLTRTYLYGSADEAPPEPLRFGSGPLSIPLAMASTGPDGGIVSTAGECLTFLEKFFAGGFFPAGYFNEMRAEYRRVMFPLQYGVGLMRFKLPRAFTMFRDIPELIGHSGLSGAFAYYCPARDLYMAGTVNQIAKPGLSYKMLAKVLSII